MRRILSLIILAAPLVFAQEAAVPPPIKQDPWKTIELEWEQVENAGSYEVKLTPVGGGPEHIFAAPENRLLQEVPVGNYRLQVRSKSKDGGDFSPWSEASTIEVAIKEITPLYPVDKAIIDAKGNGKQPVDFKWTPVEKVKEYTLKVWSEDAKDKPWIFTGKNTGKTLEVPPGQTYYWQVSFESSNDTSYYQEPKTFSFALQGTRLLKPEINKLVHNAKNLTWKASPGAAIYRAKLFYRHLDETEWTALGDAKDSATEWALHQTKAGIYKIEVIAEAPRRMSSETASYEFMIKPSQADLAGILSQ